MIMNIIIVIKNYYVGSLNEKEIIGIYVFILVWNNIK